MPALTHTPSPGSNPAAAFAGGRPVPQAHLDAVRRVIAAQYGFWVRDDWMAQFGFRVGRRMHALGMDNCNRFADLVQSDAAEAQRLIESVLNHETHFDRTPPHFDALLNVIAPDWRARGRERFRIASLGCSTGEETYSLAMFIADKFPRSEAERADIAGCDLSSAALERARAGCYPAFQLRDVEESRRQRWFEPRDDRWRVKPALRERVRFLQHNLMEPLPFVGLDVIFCRNVLIYFRKADVARIIGNFHASLNPGGWLVLGHSESAFDYPSLFKAVCATETVIYQRVNGS